MSKSDFILRYDNSNIVVTPFDPLEDYLSWITGLNSIEFVSDILHAIHGVSGSREVKSNAQLIALHARIVLGLFDQACTVSEHVRQFWA
jgi:hypothetical protein